MKVDGYEFGKLESNEAIIHLRAGGNACRAGSCPGFGFLVLFIRTDRLHFPKDVIALRWDEHG